MVTRNQTVPFLHKADQEATDKNERETKVQQFERPCTCFPLVYQGTHSNCIFKFPVFSHFSPCPTANFPCVNLNNLQLLHTQKQLLETNWNFRGKYCNILYLWDQKVYNLSKPNSLCFGKISKFPVFSLTGIFLGHFPCFPCAVGTLLYAHIASLFVQS